MKIRRLILFSALLVVAGVLSGCYTIVGRPSEPTSGITSQESIDEREYEGYDQYYDYPYSQGPGYYYDPYYSLWYPDYYYYYWGYPEWRYHDDYYYYYKDYNDGYYVPQEKPKSERRGATELRRPSRVQKKREVGVKRDDKEEQPSRRKVQRRLKNDDGNARKAVRHRQATSTSSGKRGEKKKSENEKDKEENGEHKDS